MVAVAVAVAACSVTGYAQKSLDRDSLKGVDIGVRGCVRSGVAPGSIVLDNVYEVDRDGKALPPPAPGFPTAVYSFNDTSKLQSHMGQTVEVRGRIKDIRDDEITVKPEKDAGGQLVARLPVEGTDVRATLDEVPSPVGTSGRSTLKSVVLRMDVDSVAQISESCAR
jgi:hypothetical protein